MRTPDIITLDLRYGLPDGRVEWLRGFIARALAVMGALVAAEGDPEDAALVAEIEQLAALLGGEGHAEVPASTGAECLERVRGLVDRLKRQRVERRREMAAIVALVRDAVSAVGMEMSSLHSSIEASTDRFEAIAELEDPRQIKELLVAQVAVLKQVAAERRAAWEAKQQMFNERVQLLEQQLQATRREASLDALTGVANRGSFDRECQNRIHLADVRFVIAILDVDDFKLINDTYGHAVGDRVLIALGQGLRRALREDDFVARLGGDEFGVIASNLTLRQAESRFAAVLPSVFDRRDDSEPLPAMPTVSCGLAEFSAGDTFASLYERADQALYAAKHQGKRRVVSKASPYLRDLRRN
jgi:diguanylate cyclase